MTRVSVRIVVVAALLTVLTALPATAQGRTEVVKNIPDIVVGFVVGSCGGFDIKSDWSALRTFILQYDKDGNLIREWGQYRVIGQSRYYNSTDPSVEVFGGPGEVNPTRWDFVKNTAKGSGDIWKIKLPGYGTIFHETGVIVVDLTTGTILRDTGHNQFDEQDLAALCEALTP